MAKYTKNDIVARAQELAKIISETEEVDFFKRAEAQIHSNEKIKEMMSLMKGYQKQAVNLEKYGKEEALKKMEAKLDAVENELNEIPIVQEFKQSQVEVNDLLQLVATTISNAVTDEIVRSTGGDLLRAQTGAEVASKKGNSCGHDH